MVNRSNLTALLILIIATLAFLFIRPSNYELSDYDKSGAECTLQYETSSDKWDACYRLKNNKMWKRGETLNNILSLACISAYISSGIIFWKNLRKKTRNNKDKNN